MKPTISRRSALRMAAAAAVVPAVSGVSQGTGHAHPIGSLDALAQGLVPHPGAGSNAPIRPFNLQDVTLDDGLLREKQDRMLNFARNYDERRMVYLFRANAGLANPPGVSAPGGWETSTSLLRGHYAGHFMTLLAQSYAATGEEIFANKLDYMVDTLKEVQDTITARIGSDPGGEDPGAGDIGRVDGRFGRGLRLNGDGTAQYVALPQEAVTQLTDFTVATWVNRATTQGQNWSRVFDVGTGTTANMFLTVSAGGGGARFAITTGGSGNEQRINAPSALPTGWVHVAVTLDGTHGTLYVNGAPVATNPDITIRPSDLGGGGNNWIGRSQYGDPPLNATVDEFHIFDRALSAAEVQSLLDSPAGSTGGGNIAWYRFDEENGSTALDSSPNGRDAGIVPVEAGGEHEWVPTHPGYLGALPEDVVLRLGPPRFAVYGSNQETNTWAPWYTQHKIMRGLLDAYYLTGNEKALEIVVTMAGWAHLALTVGDKNHPNYQGPITRDDLNYMWDLYIAGEYGGANEVFPEIAAITGDDAHLATAKLFDNRESLFGACAEDRDILTLTSADNPGRRRPDRLHANTHVPNFTGYLRVYEQSDDDEYFHVAKNFFGMVVPHRMYVHGGTGGNYPGSNNNTEMFQNRDNIANSIASGGAETCTTYNLLKLARNLFFHEPDPAYMDYYERGLLNQIAGSRADTNSTNDPQVTYFQPLTPGGRKGGFSNTGTCCGGTGLENHTKYQESIYFRSADGNTLWVNLYAASTLRWEEKGFTIIQETDYPREEGTRLVVDGSGALDIKLRVPAWVQKGFTVKINGSVQAVEANPGSYVTLSRTWSRGDAVEISMPFSIRIERALDRPDTQSVFYGPLLMPILGDPGDGSYRELTLYHHLKRDGDYTRAAITPTGLHRFTTHGLDLQPWYIGERPAQSPYFRRVEPEIVFGSITTGVPNRKRNDGLPNYDVPVAGVPSPGEDGPTFLDLLWDQAPFVDHGAFVRAVEEVSAEFLEAGIFSRRERQDVLTSAAQANKELEP